MRARTLIPATLTAGLLTLVTLAGCSGEDSPSAGDAGGESAQSSSPAQPPATADSGDGGDGGESGEGGEGGEGGAAETEVPEALSFTGTTVDGRPFDAKTLAGKPVVLWFWAPWCTVCQGQSAETAKVASEFQGRANVLGVAGLDEPQAMRDFVADMQVGAFPHLSDEAGDVWKKFGIIEQSVYVILDKDGKTVYEGVLPGGDGLADKLATVTG
ncbi:redoxin domain-containing protein [Streptomyces sp. WMMC500]|uniref:peroxiredoxin family protein n=1 Tax=Streptomyces sp. WMMC500 TaxID=3015154 RepID=UPI00248B47B8|nr:redoxin domain-containing protein [Streptomyces sp. WMMC500]WBB59422.1 redoxin domain-containing protein [Streptomyces sp. WMMC500]